jgi:hypothetical protein
MSSVDGQSKVLLLFAHKTSQQEKGVPTTEIDSALKSLDINQIYMRPNISSEGTLMQRRNDVLNKLAEDCQKGKLKGIIRVLIAIPRYQEGCQETIEKARNETYVQVNKTKYRTVKIPQCLLVITEENLATCGLFGSDLVQFLTEHFKCETTRGTKRKLEEIQTESEEESEKEQLKKRPKRSKGNLIIHFFESKHEFDNLSQFIHFTFVV